MKLSQLTKKFDWVNSDITEENFPIEKVRKGDYRLYHFDKPISSEDVLKEMEKEGYSPANIYELLSWRDWNNKDWVVALGSSCVLDGDRHVAYLYRYGSERYVNLYWWSYGWCGGYRFLAVRNLETKKLGTGNLDTLTLEKAIELVKKEGYKVIKEF